jgi:hypothetical protein
VRLIKLLDFAIWGSDSGEHYFIIKQLMITGQIQLEYNGWGLAYPYFQGMHVLSSGFALNSTITSLQALLFIIPIIAGLSTLLVFCIAHRVFRDPRIGLVAAGFVAVVLPHVYASSHPMPGSLGSFMLLACIFLWLKSYENRKFVLILVLSTLALVITHHMSTYFLIISLTFIILIRELLQHPQDRKRTQLDFYYLTFLITITLSYWIFYAVPFQERILAKGLPIPGFLVIPLAYLCLGALYFLITLRRRSAWQYKPKVFKVKPLAMRIVLLIVTGVLFTTALAFSSVPGTDMKIGVVAIPIFVPIIVFFSFMAISLTISFQYKDGLAMFCWFSAICISVIYSVLTKSQELLTYRHIPYAIESISVLTGVGMVKLFDIIINKKDTSFVQTENNKELIYPKRSKKPESHTGKGGVIEKNDSLAWLGAAGGVVILIVICALFSYPPLAVVSGFEEGTTENEMVAVYWAGEQIEDGATIASDHRMSSMLFGFANLNSSWEYAPNTLHGESINDYKNEVNNASTPSGKKRLDYVLISDAIMNSVALEQWETAKPMTDPAIEKFEDSPFIKIYDNGEVQIYRIGNVE